jgi:hydrogenase expression/formation protein HypD
VSRTLNRIAAGFRDGGLARHLAARIARTAEGLPPVRFMEVCGSHTMAVARFGLRGLLPENVRLTSGPGCPVCVTPESYLDHAVALATETGAVVATFGDMVRVPGSVQSLEAAAAEGARVRVVFSPLEALDLARSEASREVVFLGIGFETTAPSTAALVGEAKRSGAKNLSVLAGHKTMPAAMRALAAAPDLEIDGFLCPAHVTTIIGLEPYRFLAGEFEKPCVVAGFEPVDVLLGVLRLLEQVREGRAAVENAYSRVARPEGNPRARRLLAEAFVPVESVWRGLGAIPGSGLALNDTYAEFDAASRFSVSLPEPRPHPGCRCGDVMRGALEPAECRLFGSACRPERPLGPCMVSREGACAAAYRYGGIAA